MEYTELVEALRLEVDCAKKLYHFQGVPGYCVLLSAAADAIEELQQIADHYQEEAKDWYLAYMSTLPGRWLSVEEVLPGAEQVLINLHYPDGSNEVSLGEHWNCPDIPEEDGWGGFGGNGIVTHWMPLPAPPKEET